LTFASVDSINGGAGTADTLNYVDAGTTGGALPAALVSNIEIINVRNVNGTAAVAAVAEAVTVTFNDYTHNNASTLVLGGVTLNLAANTSAASIAAFFATTANIPNGYAVTSISGATVTFRAMTPGVLADLTAVPTLGAGSTMTATVPVVTTQGAALTASTGIVDTLAAGNFLGATEFNSNLSISDLTITGLAAGQTIGMIGNTSVANGALTATYNAGVTAGTFNVSGGTTAGAVQIIGNGDALLRTLTINSTGAANTLASIAAPAAVTAVNINAATNLVVTGGITGVAAATTITVAGAAANTATLAAVNLGALAANVTIVNAAGLTAGGITATIGAVAQVITGGAGNDTITTNGVQTGVVNAGAGTGDKLIVANITHVATTAGAKFTNFEVLQNAAAANVNFSTVAGITSLELNANGAGAVSLNAVQAAAVTNLVNNGGATLSLTSSAGTSDVLAVTQKNTTASTSADLTTVTISGFETLNVTSSSGTQGGGVSAGNDLSFTAATDLTTLTVAGAYDESINTANIVKAVTISSTQTGLANLNVTGALVKGSVVTTTGNIDTIVTTGAFADTTGDYVTYNAGAGADAITSTLAAINNTSAANGSVKIDGGAGVDTLSTDAGTYIDANFQYLTNIERVTFTGTTALNVATGGFFNTNNATTGVTFSATAIAGATANSIDATSFTGIVTSTMTQTDNNAGASFSVKSGSANDVIAVTTLGALTATTANVINTNAGNDTVTLTTAALNAAGSFTVNLGADNDTFTAAYAGAGLLNLTGGTGADVLTLGAAHTGIFTVNQGLGDSGTYAAANVTANVISTAAFDVITNLKTNDVVNLSSYTGGTALTAGAIAATSLSPTMVDNGYSVVRGTYSSTAANFTYNAAGADSLLIVDTNVAVGATAYESVVLVGQTAFATVTSAGVFTV
jgi:hypothetical protein